MVRGALLLAAGTRTPAAALAVARRARARSAVGANAFLTALLGRCFIWHDGFSFCLKSTVRSGVRSQGNSRKFFEPLILPDHSILNVPGRTVHGEGVFEQRAVTGDQHR